MIERRCPCLRGAGDKEVGQRAGGTVHCVGKSSRIRALKKIVRLEPTEKARRLCQAVVEDLSFLGRGSARRHSGTCPEQGRSAGNRGAIGQVLFDTIIEIEAVLPWIHGIGEAVIEDELAATFAKCAQIRLWFAKTRSDKNWLCFLWDIRRLFRTLNCTSSNSLNC
jgi:hypothetical protein